MREPLNRAPKNPYDKPPSAKPPFGSLRLPRCSARNDRASSAIAGSFVATLCNETNLIRLLGRSPRTKCKNDLDDQT